MKFSVASSVLALFMTYGDVFPFVRGVEVSSNLSLRASQSHEMARTLVDKTPFKSQWVQVGPKTDGIIGDDIKSYRGLLATSSDGNVVAVAWTQEVNIFEKNESGEWVPKGAPITGDVPGGSFGSTCNLSDDGNIITVGERLDDGEAGRIRVFVFVDNAWNEQEDQITGDANGDSLIEIGVASDGDILFAGAVGGRFAATYYYLQDWKIYESAVDVDATTGGADVYHLIGDKPVDATVKLYKKDCVGEEIVNDINAVSLVDDSWSSVEHKLMHKLTLNTTKINDDSLLVNFTDATTGAPKSIGSIDFCTRVETFMTTGSTNTSVTFYETNYKVNFDLTAGGNFSINTTIVSDSESEQQTNLEVDLTVKSFFCSANSFAEQTGLLQIKQNERVYVCLEPASDEVKISNLDMKLIGAEDFVYQPIEFGTTSWEADAITAVVADNASDVVRADLFPVASLFADVSTEMRIEGKAFLEFKNSATRMLNFAPYDMTVELEAVLDEDCSGGLAGIFGALFGK